ncbi:MAG TPA: helix-turn-helix transcriptional regulator [Acidimicrobiales bacterium]
MAKTGAQRYFDARAKRSPEYSRALDEARHRIAATDGLIRALEQRRLELGLSKAELARRAGMRPEVVRRLLSSASANPTLSTFIALASALSIELVVADYAPVTEGPSAASRTRRRTA